MKRRIVASSEDMLRNEAYQELVNVGTQYGYRVDSAVLRADNRIIMQIQPNRSNKYTPDLSVLSSDFSGPKIGDVVVILEPVVPPDTMSLADFEAYAQGVNNGLAFAKFLEGYSNYDKLYNISLHTKTDEDSE